MIIARAERGHILVTVAISTRSIFTAQELLLSDTNKKRFNSNSRPRDHEPNALTNSPRWSWIIYWILTEQFFPSEISHEFLLAPQWHCHQILPSTDTEINFHKYGVDTAEFLQVRLGGIFSDSEAKNSLILCCFYIQGLCITS